MGSRFTQSSFTRGELSPLLDARTKLEQREIGLKTAKNAIVHQEGAISNRMGLEYCGVAKYSNKATRVMRFVFNSEQTYMLEFGDKYIRFLKNGGYIIHGVAYGGSFIGTYDLDETGTNDNNETYYKYTVGGAIYDYQLQGCFYLKNTIAANETVYLDKNFETVYISESNSLAKGKITKIENGYVYIDYDATEYAKRNEIVEISTPYAAEDLSRLKRSQSGDILTITHPNYPTKNLSRFAHDYWTLEDAVFTPDIEPPTNVSATWHGSTSSNTRTYKYLVTSVDEETNEESSRSSIASVTGHREANWLTDEYMTISWTAVSGAAEYNIYREVNGVFGYIGTAEGTTFDDTNIEPDLKETAPVYKNPFANNNYPSCSAYFQQRKMYANSEKNPQTLWTSKQAALNNFNISRPLVATDAITLTMDDREMNEIRHLIPMKDLVVLTSNSEWKVNGTDGVFQANPMPAAVIQSYYGASHIEPVVSGNQIIFVQAGGSVLRDLGWDLMSEGYDGDELSLFSSHLFYGKEVVSMAYAKEPFRLLYVIFNDGSAAIMTYNKKQKLCGWTQLVTDGLFESVDVVREGLEDVAYFVISRKINNQTVKFIERTMTRIIKDASEAFLVDCGLAAKFTTPQTTIHGLDHLNGRKVICNVNGGIIDGLTVEDGAITLPKPAYSIVVGLPYEFELETLNIEGENTQGLKKVINYISIKIYDSREDFVFCGADGREFRHSRCDDSINHSGHLYSKDIAQTVFSLPKTDATVKLKQTYPLPLTILSISAAVDIQNNEND